MRIGGFHPEARAELEAAALWYEDLRAGLGIEFLAAVREGLEQIGANPLRWPKLTKRSRAYRLKRFPYRVVYQVRGEEVVIVAVMHLGRKAGVLEGEAVEKLKRVQRNP